MLSREYQTKQKCDGCTEEHIVLAVWLCHTVLGKARKFKPEHPMVLKANTSCAQLKGARGGREKRVAVTAGGSSKAFIISIISSVQQEVFTSSLV